MGFRDRLVHAYNVLLDRNNEIPSTRYQGIGYSYRPDRPRYRYGNDRSIVTEIYTRIAVDCASVSIQHVRLDDNGRFSEVMNSSLQECLTLSANIDQTGRALIQDAVMSMCDEGVVAIVPIDTSVNPETGAYQIESLRVGKILQWYPRQIQVRLYNDRTGRHEEIFVEKENAAIIENPFFAIMNEPNSTLKRLIQKLSMLDMVDEQNASGKLDIIIQLPYVVKTPQRKAQAEERRKDIEMQLAGSKYGIAYIDGTEHITQLNRAAENNLFEQVKYLTDQAFDQLGMTLEVLKGTADEATMLNYENRIIEPILSVIVGEFKRKFLTKTARSQGQSVMFFRDAFRLVPVSQIAEIADKLTRNEILSPNEVRAIIGYKPDKNPESDELRNRNLNQKAEETEPPRKETEEEEENKT